MKSYGLNQTYFRKIYNIPPLAHHIDAQQAICDGVGGDGVTHAVFADDEPLIRQPA